MGGYMNGGNAWSADEVEILRKLFAQGLSARAISQQVPGHSRNSVIGKMHRLGLGKLDRPIKTAQAGRKKPARPKEKWGHDGKGPNYVPPVKLIVEPYEEPDMPVLEGDAKLHSRQHRDLEPGMCQWPVYFEQGVQMYCACNTERLPGRFSTYCKTHKLASEVPQSERRSKYRGKVWGG